MSAPYGEFPLVQITVDVGAATREYTCQLPFGVRITRSYSAADAADSTDKYTATVIYDGNTIKTGTTVVATDTIYEDIGVDAAYSDFIPANSPFKVKFTFAGTATNVKGCRFTLMGAVKR